MNTTVRLSVIALLVLAALGVPRPADLAPDRPEAAPPKATGAQEVEVVAVLIDQNTQQPTVVLQGKRDKRSVELAIGLAEATGIAVPLQGVTPPRPLTHDLFLTLFGRLKVTLTRVVITDLRDDVFYAIVYLNTGGRSSSSTRVRPTRSRWPSARRRRCSSRSACSTRPAPARSRAARRSDEPWPSPSAPTRSGRSSGAWRTSSPSSARSSAISPVASRRRCARPSPSTTSAGSARPRRASRGSRSRSAIPTCTGRGASTRRRACCSTARPAPGSRSSPRRWPPRRARSSTT